MDDGAFSNLDRFRFAQRGAFAPYDQVPGMGSTENAVPLANPIADERQQRLSEADQNALMARLTGLGMAMAARRLGY